MATLHTESMPFLWLYFGALLGSVYNHHVDTLATCHISKVIIIHRL